MTKEESLRHKEITKKTSLSKLYLRGAESALENGHFRVAADVAYNAAELVMKSAILKVKDSLPKSHGGIAQKFSLLFVKEGYLNPETGGNIKKGLIFRNKARYDEEAEITEKHAKHNITLAKELIKFLEKEMERASDSSDQ